MLRGKGGRGMVEEDVVAERVRYKMSLKALQSIIKDIEPCQGAFGTHGNRPHRTCVQPAMTLQKQHRVARP